MRIAMMIESDGPGGSEMMVFRLSEELRRRGHEIFPVIPRNGTGWLGDLYQKADFSFDHYWLNGPLDPGGVMRLLKIQRKYDVDVVHSHDFTMAVYGCASSRLARVPNVITMHGGVNVCAVLRRRMALRWAIRNSFRTAMVSRATAIDYATALGLPVDRFDVVPNGVPVREGNANKLRAELGITNEIVILAVGNLEPHKGHLVLLDALSRLAQRTAIPKWKLVIAGGRGGPEREAMEAFMKQHSLEDRVHILTGRSDIPDLLALADIYTMPSLIEGLPMALLEAMVADKPIVASVTAGIPEAITHERDGLLVPAGDAEALANALSGLMLDPQRRARFAEAAGARGRAEFTLEVMTNHYERLYEAAVSSAS